jgi:spermidine/putrescine ABC transporter ATP-binding subunit
VSGHGQRVVVEEVWRCYGSVEAVAGVSLDVAAGEFVSLLGPSGSGKTTLLMILAGFEQPQSGRVRVGERDITHVPPNKRDVAMVFQRYALFPHMTVAQNIAFPLRMRGVARAVRDAAVTRALEIVQLQGYGDRTPAQLSGGQQQRVALARAIVFDPPVILMDEPLGALDKKLRQHMQIELKQLQQRLGATVIYVTHDQEEALTMSDRVAVMDHGRLMQLGTPRELYDRPANAFVADFIGEMNFLRAVVVAVEDTVCRLRLHGIEVTAARGASVTAGQRVRMAIRPEHVEIAPGAEGLAGRLGRVVFNGASLAMLVELPGGEVVRADVPARSDLAALQPGAPVSLRWQAEAAATFADAAP